MFMPAAIVGETVPAIICGHGFSQGPGNYASTLELLRQQGWLVIAPKTDLLDTLWRQIEGAGAKAKMPGQLQVRTITAEPAAASMYVRCRIGV